MGPRLARLLELQRLAEAGEDPIAIHMAPRLMLKTVKILFFFLSLAFFGSDMQVHFFFLL